MLSSELAEDQLARVEPLAASGYAESHGWTRVATLRNGSALLRLQDYEDRFPDLIVPPAPDYADYARRIYDVVTAISAQENQPASAVLAEMLTPADVLRFRLASAETEDGTCSVDALAAFFHGLLKSLQSAARDEEKPEIYHPQLVSTTTQDFLQRCRAGQTERGSYVATIHCPLGVPTSPAQAIQPTLIDLPPAPPFARKVTTRFMRSLDLLNLAAQNQASVSVERPLCSVNFMDAVSALRPPGDQGILDVRCNWSHVFAPEPATPTAVEIRSANFPVIADIANRLRPQDEPREMDFFGKVYALIGDANDKNKVEGEVTIRYIDVDEESAHSARVALAPEQYKMACDAHIQGKYISLHGVLHKTANTARIEFPSAFTVQDYYSSSKSLKLNYGMRLAKKRRAGQV